MGCDENDGSDFDYDDDEDVDGIALVSPFDPFRGVATAMIGVQPTNQQRALVLQIGVLEALPMGVPVTAALPTLNAFASTAPAASAAPTVPLICNAPTQT
eukprot:CAMPEP_0176009978 /NCGR_PEP_ID=MMETSP0120_2-20121206/4528_1 /TAXON_ID=160619 /ORGANISM="Kryptoperidinium foliaceum, Strain CCMP 1326" /LENGTH=99 /DNA_ID=CAMNT_0017342789 /DNA_START=85 /DNA_END=381 /DNA_ORIENTATION=-